MTFTISSTVTEGPRDTLYRSKYCQLVHEYNTKGLQPRNDLQLHSRSKQLLLIDRPYIISCLWSVVTTSLSGIISEITTFSVYVTVCDIEKSFTFDSKV